jgi:ribosomal-protein-alanine N-acetyltransferase
MSPEDLDRVMEIAESLKDAPHWTRANYLAVLDLDSKQDANRAAAPRRIALVDAQVQRRGLARRLFAELAGKLRLAGVTEVILEVRACNQPALALYRRLGFAETGRRPCYYQAPADDAVLMRLGLEGLEP